MNRQRPTGPKRIRSETGLQLLARVTARPDVTNADPFIFQKSSTSSGQIIELYGGEGVGKTELALHCVARTCMPSSFNGTSLAGLQAKVIFIDTESKFSILRLAVVIEKQILEEINSQSSSQQKIKCNKECNHLQVENGSEDTIENPVINNTKGEGSLLHNAERHSSPLHDDSSKTSQMERKLSPQEVEELVKDSLDRIQVLRPSDSLQLLVSLLSVEKMFLEDSKYTMLVIDSINAFHALDKFASPRSYKHLDSRMIPIAKLLKKYATEFGVTCLLTKSVYYYGKKTSEQDRYAICSGASSECEMTSNAYTYKEFLGRTWSSLCIKKVCLTSCVKELSKTDEKSNSVKIISANLMSGEAGKQYIFKDDFLIPL